MLGQLREIFEDELLIMAGRRFELTQKGKSLIEPVERACAELELLLGPADFDPLTEARRFVVATADYVTFLLAPPLTQIMGEEAPRASVQFIDISADLTAKLGRGEVDIIAVPEGIISRSPDRLHHVRLFDDDSVVISSATRQNFSGKLTRQIYEASPHAMFHLAQGLTGHEDRILHDSKVRHEDRILVENFLALPAIVASSDCLAIVQRRLAERFQQSYDIRIQEFPFPNARLSIFAYWPKSFDRDPAHSWFREVLLRAAAMLEERVDHP